jgi:hypothetical protein
MLIRFESPSWSATSKQFFRVEFALISGTDEMSIKHERDKIGDYRRRYDNRRHKSLGHNSSSYT